MKYCCLSGKERLRCIRGVAWGHTAGGPQRLASAPRLGTPRSLLFGLRHAASPGAKAWVWSSCRSSRDAAQTVITNPHSDTNLAGLVFSHFATARRSSRNPSEVRWQLGSQAGKGSRYTWFENWGLLPSCYHLQRPTGERGRVGSPEEWRAGGQGRRNLQGGVMKAWVPGPHSLTYAHTCTRTLLTYHVLCSEQDTQEFSQPHLLVVKGTKQKHRLDLLQFTGRQMLSSALLKL